MVRQELLKAEHQRVQDYDIWALRIPNQTVPITALDKVFLYVQSKDLLELGKISTATLFNQYQSNLPNCLNNVRAFRSPTESLNCSNAFIAQVINALFTQKFLYYRH